MIATKVIKFEECSAKWHQRCVFRVEKKTWTVLRGLRCDRKKSVKFPVNIKKTAYDAVNLPCEAILQLMENSAKMGNLDDFAVFFHPLWSFILCEICMFLCKALSLILALDYWSEFLFMNYWWWLFSTPHTSSTMFLGNVIHTHIYVFHHKTLSVLL